MVRYVRFLRFDIRFADAITEHLLEHGDALPQQLGVLWSFEVSRCIEKVEECRRGARKYNVNKEIRLMILMISLCSSYESSIYYYIYFLPFPFFNVFSVSISTWQILINLTEANCRWFGKTLWIFGDINEYTLQIHFWWSHLGRSRRSFIWSWSRMGRGLHFLYRFLLLLSRFQESCFAVPFWFTTFVEDVWK